MGDRIVIKEIEVIYGGLIQIDLQNESTGQWLRCFVEPKDLFTMIGDAMQKNYENFD